MNNTNKNSGTFSSEGLSSSPPLTVLSSSCANNYSRGHPPSVIWLTSPDLREWWHGEVCVSNWIWSQNWTEKGKWTCIRATTGEKTLAAAKDIFWNFTSNFTTSLLITDSGLLWNQNSTHLVSEIGEEKKRLNPWFPSLLTFHQIMSRTQPLKSGVIWITKLVEGEHINWFFQVSAIYRRWWPEGVLGSRSDIL